MSGIKVLAVDFGRDADEIINHVRASMWAGGPNRDLVLAKLQGAYDRGRGDERIGPPVPGTIEAIPGDQGRAWIIR